MDLVATPDPSISILSLVIFLISNVYNNERQFQIIILNNVYSYIILWLHCSMNNNLYTDKQ
jgi:hypothetical protein